ncbi:MAG: indolepyruvate oxidoreductase subunit B, partial [Deltaproteobacteria bacterium]|nr:indolepyruvate oxidoreductase subunit B [Deltaproteobacteria bacterium]
PDEKRHAPTPPDLLEHEVSHSMPALAQATAIEGVRRLIAYQGAGYAKLYLNRLRRIADADAAAGARGALVKEVARHLAVRMSYEDVVRVAQAKISPARMRRIAREELRVKDEPFSVHDFLKPGIEELCQLLPSFLARPILHIAQKKGWLGRVYFGMEINSTSVGGYLRFLLLAKLRKFRPYGHRYAQEQRQIESWLGLIVEAARRSGELSLEVAECARLIKGYGDTHARGLASYGTIEARLIRPALAGHIPLARAADAVASARTAALVDPEGESLAKCLAEIDGQAAFRIAAE